MLLPIHEPTWVQGRGGLPGALLQAEWSPGGSAAGQQLPLGQQHQWEGPAPASSTHARVQPVGVCSGGLRQLEQAQHLVRACRVQPRAGCCCCCGTVGPSCMHWVGCIHEACCCTRDIEQHLPAAARARREVPAYTLPGKGGQAFRRVDPAPLPGMPVLEVGGGASPSTGREGWEDEGAAVESVEQASPGAPGACVEGGLPPIL